MANEKQVPVHYLSVPGTLSDEIDTSGGIVVEMCTTCYALVPTDMVQEHIDRHHQTGEDHTPGWEPGQNIQNRPDQGLPPEGQAPPEVSGGPPTYPDQSPPAEQGPPPEVSGGPPPTAGQQPA